jgi:hypothetical protein
VIFGSQLDQSVLNQPVKEFFKNHVLKKSTDENGKSSIKLIQITPFGVTRISKPI